MHVNVSVTVKTVDRISLFDGGKLEERKNLKDTINISSFLYVRIELDQLLRVI